MNSQGGHITTRDAPVALAIVLALVALSAFAANSILCRMALGAQAIDAYSFTAVRLGSGAVVLLLVNNLRGPRYRAAAGSWTGAFFLVVYALPFSLAYVRLNTGVGALLLFAAVQLTMIGHGIRRGERPPVLEWLGLLGAVVGVVYLLSPGLAAPDPIGAGFMIVAGVGWGSYSVIGKAAGDPVSVTAASFQRAALLVVPLTALVWPWLKLSPRGAMLAASSGALASGLGYTVWYAALKHLPLTRAALIQLAVPVIASVGGAAFIGERITLRLALASTVILGSIALGLVTRARGVRAPVDRPKMS